MSIKQRVLKNEVTEDENTRKSNEKQPKIVSIVFISLLLDLLAFTMILPLFPAILEYYLEVDNKQGLFTWILRQIRSIQLYLNVPEKLNSVLFGGFLGSMYSFLQFLAMPIVGALSDIYGRKPLMIICLSGIALSYLLWAISYNFAIFVLARFVGGISKGNISLSMAIITDVTNVKNRGKSLALVGIAFSIGFTVGPMIGVLFSKLSINTKDPFLYIYPAILGLFLALSDLYYVIYCLDETLPVYKRAKSLTKGIFGALIYLNPLDLFKFSAVTGLTSNESRDLRILGCSYFLYLFVYSGLEFTLTFLAHHTFQFTNMQQGYMFLVMGLTMTLIQGYFVRRISAEKIKFFAELGLWLIVPAFIVIGMAYDVISLYCGVLIFSISTALAVTCQMTLVTRIGPDNQKGTITGIFRSLGALARACGPILASIAFWTIGSTKTYLIGACVLIFPPLILQQVSNY